MSRQSMLCLLPKGETKYSGPLIAQVLRTAGIAMVENVRIYRNRSEVLHGMPAERLNNMVPEEFALLPTPGHTQVKGEAESHLLQAVLNATAKHPEAALDWTPFLTIVRRCHHSYHDEDDDSAPQLWSGTFSLAVYGDGSPISEDFKRVVTNDLAWRAIVDEMAVLLCAEIGVELLVSA